MLVKRTRRDRQRETHTETRERERRARKVEKKVLKNEREERKKVIACEDGGPENITHEFPECRSSIQKCMSVCEL